MRMYCVYVRRCIVLNFNVATKRAKTYYFNIILFEILNKIENHNKLVNFVNEFRIGCATIHDIGKKPRNDKRSLRGQKEREYLQVIQFRC